MQLFRCHQIFQQDHFLGRCVSSLRRSSITLKGGSQKRSPKKPVFRPLHTDEFCRNLKLLNITHLWIIIGKFSSLFTHLKMYLLTYNLKAAKIPHCGLIFEPYNKVCCLISSLAHSLKAVRAHTTYPAAIAVLTAVYFFRSSSAALVPLLLMLIVVA